MVFKKGVPPPAKKKSVVPKTPPPGPVDNMDDFDEDNGGIVTQVATYQPTTSAHDVLHDDLEFTEPGDSSSDVDPVLAPNISSMPRPQPTPQPTRRVVSQAQMQRTMNGGSNPSNPVKSVHPFKGGSLLNGREYPDVDPTYCQVIFGRVKATLQNRGVMNVRSNTKQDIHSAFLQTMGAPFENREYFSDLVEHFCKLHNILRT